MSVTPQFFNVQPVEAALATLFSQWSPQVRTQIRDPREALGRVLASTPRSPINLPGFARSTVDGYAVRAADTFGASQSLPAYLHYVGEVLMGTKPTLTAGQGETLEIHTGGMLPRGTDAVVMVERTQVLGAGEIEILAPVAPGENVIQVGEDVAEGQALLPIGHRIRPQDIGGLLAVGILSVEVALAPRVGILSCGDELVTPDEMPAMGQIRDINAYTLAALIEAAGGESVFLGIARDTLEDFMARAQEGFSAVDVLVMTAGSSVSTRDYTRQVIDSLGEPGVLQHGLAVKPGKPTIIGICDNKPVIGLPGNPVSALLVARQIVVPIIKELLGQTVMPTPSVQARLASSIASTTGRDDSVPVKIIAQDGELIAEPVFGKSNLIYTLVNADGLVRVPLNSNGLKAGTLVDVVFFENSL